MPIATMGKKSAPSYLTLHEVKQRADHVFKLSRMMQRRVRAEKLLPEDTSTSARWPSEDITGCENAPQFPPPACATSVYPFQGQEGTKGPCGDVL